MMILFSVFVKMIGRHDQRKCDQIKVNEFDRKNIKFYVRLIQAI